MFSWFRNSLLVSYCGACWWAPFGWFLGRRGGLGSAARCQCLLSPAGRAADQPLAFGLACFWSTVCVASVSCHQQHKVLSGPAFFVGHSKIVKVREKHRSHSWKLGASVMGRRIKIKPKNRVLLSWHWSVNSVSNERFCHSQLRAHFFYPGFSGKTLIKHLPLHLPCPDNNRFKSGIERVFEPSKLV